MPSTLRLSTLLLALFCAATAVYGRPPESNPMEEFWRNAQTSHHFNHVRVATADELTAAMVAAGRSGRPTIIRVAPGTYGFTQTFSSDFDTSFLPPVTTTIVIDGGNAATATLDNASINQEAPFRYFTVLKGGRLLLRNLTVKNAILECDLDDCSHDGGGAALNGGGDLWIEDCDFTANTTLVENGSGISFGGAILNVSGDLQIERSHIDGNLSVGNGAGIALLGGSGYIRDSTVNGNFGDRENARDSGLNEGAGIYVVNAKLRISRTTISGNTQSQAEESAALSFGAGIYSLDSEVRLEDSAIVENVDFSAGSGGGIANSGTMFIRNTTIAGNTGGSYGGGIANSGHLELQGVTLTNNFANSLFDDDEGNVTFPPNCSPDPGPCIGLGGGIENDPSGKVLMADTVIANNLPASPAPDCSGVLISEGHNDIGNTTGCTIQHRGSKHDELNVDPKLGGLEDDGTPGNQHYPPLANSPLIDAGDDVGESCTPRDQIGQPRVNGGPEHGHGPECDIGAIEYQPPHRL